MLSQVICHSLIGTDFFTSVVPQLDNLLLKMRFFITQIAFLNPLFLGVNLLMLIINATKLA
jgi:hypothetical protein